VSKCRSTERFVGNKRHQNW